MATFTEHLRAREESGLAALLRARPDLAAPPPSSVRSLAARAANRASLDHALSGLDALVLACLDAVLALEASVGTSPVLGGLAPAMGTDVATLRRPVRTALDLALLWTEDPGAAWHDDDGLAAVSLRPAPGLLEVLGPYPAGLGPPLTWSLGRRTPQTLERLAAELGIGDAVADATGEDPDRGRATGPAAEATGAVTVLARHLGDPDVVRRLLDSAPSGARPVLDALTWGPPVGRAPSASPTGPPGAARSAVDWLLRHGLLAVGDAQHVILPGEVGLALRGGRTHRKAPVEPPTEGAPVDPRTVAAEAARQAEDVVRLVAGLVDTWGREQPLVLKSGGLGSRELRRLTTRLGTSEAVGALVVEVAGAAGLVADDAEELPSLAPTTDADEWLRLGLPERWSAVARGWLWSERAAWLVGTRDDRGGLRAALDPELRRPWAPRLRLSVLQVLAGAADVPAALTATNVHGVLAWRAPRSTPPLHVVESVLAEAQVLGVTGAGVLSPAGRALLTAALHPVADGADAAQALAAQLAPTVDDMLLQGDLTGIVPGRPSDELADLLERSAHIESRGAALTVRFTEASVRSALDGGLTAEQLLSRLSRHARSGVPQPLEYLVLDAARRHGQVRVGMASSYLRADDPTLLAGLAEDRSLRALGLLQLAPTVLAAQAPVPVVLAALRDRGLAPVAEDSTGMVLVLSAPPRRIGSRTARRAGALVSIAAPPAAVRVAAEEAQARRLARLARDLLAADRREDAAARDGLAAREASPGAPPPWGTPDPVLALALLREAAAEGREVWLDLIGPDGSPQRRRVRPLRVDGGRARAVDAEREAELTVAVHRIAGVSPV